MNIVGFGRLMSYIGSMVGHRLELSTVADIHEHVQMLIEHENETAHDEIEQLRNRIGVLEATNSNDVELINHMVWALAQNPPRKIEAIKAHRKLTHMGLKESKDAIEGVGPHIEGNW